MARIVDVRPVVMANSSRDTETGLRSAGAGSQRTGQSLLMKDMRMPSSSRAQRPSA